MDARAGELRKQGVRIKLQDQPFTSSRLCCGSPAEVVTRDELRAQICRMIPSSISTTA